MFLHPYKTPRTTEDAADAQERAIDRMSAKQAIDLEFINARWDDLVELIKKAKDAKDDGHVGSHMAYLLLAAQEIEATSKQLKY